MKGLGEANCLSRTPFRQEHDSIFPADLPAFLFFVQSLSNLISSVTQANNDVALNGPQAAYLWRSSGACHWTNGHVEGRASRRRAVIRELAVIKVSFENDEIRTGEMQEEIRRFGMELPEGVASTPERVLFVHPFAFCFVLLPPATKPPQRLFLVIGSFGEQLAINQGVEQPLPVFLRNIGHKPSKAFSVEANLLRKAALDEKIGVHAIAIQLKSSIIKHKVDSTARLLTELFRALPKLVEVITKNIFLGGSEMVTPGGLEGLYLFLGHVDQEREISRVAPETN